MKTREETFRIYTIGSLGVGIQHFRRQAGLSQADLARRANLHRSYLSSLENGRETQHLKRLFRVLRQLGVRMTLQKAGW